MRDFDAETTAAARKWDATEMMKPRPVYARMLLRRAEGRHHGILPPPTDAEKHDAILLLADPYADDVGDEAFRILDEYGR